MFVFFGHILGGFEASTSQKTIRKQLLINTYYHFLFPNGSRKTIWVVPRTSRQRMIPYAFCSLPRGGGFLRIVLNKCLSSCCFSLVVLTVVLQLLFCKCNFAICHFAIVVLQVWFRDCGFAICVFAIVFCTCGYFCNSNCNIRKPKICKDQEVIKKNSDYGFARKPMHISFAIAVLQENQQYVKSKRS